MSAEREERPSSSATDAGLGRRAVLQTLMAGAGAAVGVPALAHEHPLRESLQDPAKIGAAERRARAAGYKPVFLDQHLFDTLGVLSESIVPGSRNAKVAEFIDALVAVERPESQRQLLVALGAFEGLALAEHRKTWKALTPAEQNALLTKASTAEPGQRGPKAPDGGTRTVRDHFDHLKGWISGAYYSSEAGMKELGWKGVVIHPKLLECGPGGSSA
jgi:hypothetical protein